MSNGHRFSEWRSERTSVPWSRPEGLEAGRTGEGPLQRSTIRGGASILLGTSPRSCRSWLLKIVRVPCLFRFDPYGKSKKDARNGLVSLRLSPRADDGPENTPVVREGWLTIYSNYRMLCSIPGVAGHPGRPRLAALRVGEGKRDESGAKKIFQASGPGSWKIFRKLAKRVLGRRSPGRTDRAGSPRAFRLL